MLLKGSRVYRMCSSRQNDLVRIGQALRATSALLLGFQERGVMAECKTNGDPVTAADSAADRLLRELLLQEGEGWLSEETRDDLSRLKAGRTWIVDPLDGTREFIAGIPEWCVSVGLVECEQVVAGGISNPATGEMFVGSIESGLQTSGIVPDVATSAPSNATGVVLASRTEVLRGQWQSAPPEIAIRPMGSVAYKLARVAAGLAAATWTLVPKNEWDIAGGVALVLAGGGTVRSLEGEVPRFNQRDPLISGLLAFAAGKEHLEQAAARHRESFNR